MREGAIIGRRSSVTYKLGGGGVDSMLGLSLLCVAGILFYSMAVAVEEKSRKCLPWVRRLIRHSQVCSSADMGSVLGTSVANRHSCGKPTVVL